MKRTRNRESIVLTRDEKDFLKKLGKRMREKRLSAGLTIRRLYCLTEIGQTTICNYENGVRRPTALALYRISKALGIDIKEFFE